MRHPLDGARFKIIRAQEHFDAFKTEGAAFLDTKPYRFESEVYGDYWWVKPRATVQPPLRLSGIIGDCVTNIRASLDYVVWELAGKYFTIAIDLSRPGDRQILNFPILLPDPNRSKGHIDHLHRLAKRGFPTGAIQVVKDVQADVSGNPALQWLYELVNTDKHRTPILTVASFSAAQIELRDFRNRDWLIRSDVIRFGVTIDTKEPDLLAFVRDHPMNVNVQASVQIACQDVAVPDVPIERTLEQIIETVANIIPRFDPFF